MNEYPCINPDVEDGWDSLVNAEGGSRAQPLAPTFHVLHTAHGGGYSATATYPLDADAERVPVVVFAGVRQVFNPRITNVSAIDLYVRRIGEPWPQVPTLTRYTLNKADTVTLCKNGLELQIYCGTHATGEGTLDPYGARDFWLEKDQIPDFFQEGD